jgi:hypothetical protein
VPAERRKTIVHPGLGELELDCQVRCTDDQPQVLLEPS